MPIKINDYTKDAKINELIEVKEVNGIDDFILKIYFNDGKIQVIDFSKLIFNSHSVYVKEFQNPQKFREYKIQDGNIIWGDFDMIFPVESLYKNDLT